MNNGNLKWGKCKVKYNIDEFGFWLNWEDIANILNLDTNFKWVTYENTKSILCNKYDDRPFVDSFLIWLENEVKPFIMREEKRLKAKKNEASLKAVSAKNAQTQSKAVEAEPNIKGKQVSKAESQAVKTDIKVFNFEAKEIRVIIKDNEPLFCAFDLCRVLEYKNGKDTINRIFGDGVVKCYPIKDRLNRVQEAKFLTESQMYKLIMRSKAKCAEALQDFVYKEVLPSIRKTGGNGIKDSEKHLPMPINVNTNIAQVDVQVFSFGDLQVETIFKNDTPYFRLADISKILGLENAHKDWIRNKWFDDDEIIERKSSNISTDSKVEKIHFANGRNFDIGGKPIKYVAESGLYRILNRTNSPKARPFERWVTKEVLPSIRKTGGYAIQNQYKLPQTYAEALLEAGRLALENEKLQAQIETDKPKVDFANNVSKAENEISIGEFAKILNIKGLGEKNLFKWLRDEGYLRLNNMPYQEFINKGYFRVVEKTREDKNGRIYTCTQTLITGQGQIYFVNLLRPSAIKVKNELMIKSYTIMDKGDKR